MKTYLVWLQRTYTGVIRISAEGEKDVENQFMEMDEYDTESIPFIENLEDNGWEIEHIEEDEYAD